MKHTTSLQESTANPLYYDKIYMERLGLDQVEIQHLDSNIGMAFVHQVINNIPAVREPDRQRLADLFIKAQGDFTTSRSFAKTICIDHTQYSKIRNGRYAGKITDETLFLVALHAAPGSGVTMASLLEAMGRQIPPRSTNINLNHSEAKHEIIQPAIFKGIILSALVEAGYAVKRSDESDIFHFSFSISKDGITEITKDWHFKIIDLPTDDTLGSTMQEINATLGMLYTHTINHAKISFVTGSKSKFECLITKLNGFTIPDEVSLILINTEEYVAEKEYPIPTTSDNKSTFPLGE